MIKHIVMWTVKGSEEGIDKKVALSTMKGKLEAMSGKIEALLSIEVGINVPESAEAFEICLITTHKDWAGLKEYQEHPIHKEVGKYIGEVRKSRAVVDFEF